MTTAQATREWLAAGLRPDRRGLGGTIFLLILASGVLALSAKIQFPIGPVPFTMQSLVVLLIGLGYGSRLGTAALLAYLAEGAAGLPVFAGPAAGISYFAGPSAGFLIGFVLAAGLVGWLAEHGWGRGMARLSVTLAAGHVLLFVPGVLWLAALAGWTNALAVGVTPFITITIVKTALGVAMVAAFRSALGKHPSSRA
ncbi:MAG TPA: biotin transporter BioY [Acetobacteraceae bacterium]|jgi:biotin transport system substrate-specific component